MQKVKKLEGMIPLSERLAGYFRGKTTVLHRAEKSRRTLLILAEKLFGKSSKYYLACVAGR